LEPGRGVLVSLHRALPVPDKDVPLQDILEFRTKRSDELIALRRHLEEIYGRIVSAGDSDLALKTELERLQQAINDYTKVFHERRFKFRMIRQGQASPGMMQPVRRTLKMADHWRARPRKWIRLSPS
jgi:hypothetical protein